MLTVAVATSAAYLPWGATMIHSLQSVHPEGVRTIVLHDGQLTPDDIARLRSMEQENAGAIEVPEIPEAMLHRLPSKERFGGRTAILPMLLPELYPDLRRVLCIDADALVVSRLETLFDTDLAGAPLAAVRNVVEPPERQRLVDLGLDPLCYLNSGVILYDLDALRSEGAHEEVISAAAGLQWFDQDALNLVFEGRWKSVHPRYNAMNSYWTWREMAVDVLGSTDVETAKQDPAILHFEGPAFCKPWHYLCSHPWRETYRATLAGTPWASTPIEGRSLVTQVIRALPESWRPSAYWRLRKIRSRFGETRRGAQ